ncbi:MULTISPECIES: hypothetical protein [Priestia]|uniref:hypothetical protein n=1 Tax=Priestia TaxID=2800373 RepID=UPI001C8ED60D|nr:hypothetical protein [Priestia aryabhattai]MBY0210635.1 hypothetical protein [Priestia aryabhattai]
MDAKDKLILEQEFTLAKLVKKYGSKAQRHSLKNKGNLTGKEFSILMKSVDTEWESYKVDGRGSKRVITCYGKRSKKAQRIDRRCNNGQKQLVGEFELNSLIINHLLQQNNKVKPMSATKWLINLGIVGDKLTEALYGAKGGHLKNLQEQFSKVIKDYNKTDSDIEMLDEFTRILLKNMKASLVSVFKKLAKAEVIIYQTEIWGCTQKNNHRKLKRKEINETHNLKRILLTKHGIKSNDLFKANMKGVKEFKQDFQKQLREQLGIKFYYDAHFCKVQDSDLGMKEYLYNLREQGVLDSAISLKDFQISSVTQVYKDKYSQRSLKLAKGREKNITNISDSDRVKCLKIMKQYAPMWNLLLKYFKYKSCIKSNLSAVKLEASEKIEHLETTKRELVNQQQAGKSPQNIAIILEDQVQPQGSNTKDKAIDEVTKSYYTQEYFEYLEAMEDIKTEIRWYEDKYGHDAMEHIMVDVTFRELTGAAKVEGMIAEFKQKIQHEKELERKKWDKIFERGKSDKRVRTKKIPLNTY